MKYLDTLAAEMGITKQALYHRIKLANVAFPADDFSIQKKRVGNRNRSVINELAAKRLMEYHRYHHRKPASL